MRLLRLDMCMTMEINGIMTFDDFALKLVAMATSLDRSEKGQIYNLR